MLQTQTVVPELLELLKNIMTDPASLFLLQKSLTYFEEADYQPNPIVFDKQYSWDKCKQKIVDEALKL